MRGGSFLNLVGSNASTELLIGWDVKLGGSGVLDEVEDVLESLRETGSGMVWVIKSCSKEEFLSGCGLCAGFVASCLCVGFVKSVGV